MHRVSEIIITISADMSCKDPLPLSTHARIDSDMALLISCHCGKPASMLMGRLMPFHIVAALSVKSKGCTVSLAQVTCND